MKLNRKKLDEVQDKYPVFADGTYFAKLEVEVTENKAKTGHNLKVKARLVADELFDREGNEMQNRNFVVNQYHSLVPTDEYDPDNTIKQLANAVGIPEEVQNSEDGVTVEMLNGKYCKVILGYQAATEKYGESNTIKKYVAITEDDEFNAPE